MKYYRIKCLCCSGLFVGLEPRDDYVCDACAAEKRDRARYFQCPDCKNVFGIKVSHDGHYRCTRCINKRKRDMELYARAERYRIKMFGKEGGKV